VEGGWISRLTRVPKFQAAAGGPSYRRCRNFTVQVTISTSVFQPITSMTRWFEQKRAQYLSKNAQFGAQSKNTKKRWKNYWFEQIRRFIKIKILKLFGKNFDLKKNYIANIWNFVLNQLQFWQICMNLFTKSNKKWQKYNFSKIAQFGAQSIGLF